MEALAIAALLLLPGAWIAFALRDGAAGFGVRVAWAVALSPLIVAAEFFLARRATATFPQTAWLVAALNAPALILIWRRWRARIPAVYESSEWEIWRGVVLYLAVAACVALPWWANPSFRVYSFQGLLQLDVIYGIATRGIPGEAELAGAALAYPWAPHVAWALEAAAAQKSPTLLYPVNNLLLLAAAGVLSYELARAVGASKASATAATAFLAGGPHLPWLLGDKRHMPIAHNFVAFDPMPLGIVLHLGLALAVVELVKRPRRQEMLLLGAGLVAMAALYPDLYPAGAALAAGAVAVLAWRARRDEGLRAPAIDAAGWAAAGLVAGYFIMDFYAEDRAAQAAALTSLPELAGKTVVAALGLGPFVAAAWLYWRARPERREALSALAVGAGGALGCYLALRMGGLNEYKFYLASAALLAAPALLGVCERIPPLRARVGWITFGSLAALTALTVSYSRNRLPRDETAPAVDERGFFLSPTAGNRDGRWMTAVRAKCDLETVLVIDRPKVHVSAFTVRKLLVGSDSGRRHAGCNLPVRFNLVDLRGYDQKVVEWRLTLLERVYRPKREYPPAELAALLEEIVAEAGPNLAFVFLPGDDRSFLDWLQRERHVRVIYDDGSSTVVAP